MSDTLAGKDFPGRRVLGLFAKQPLPGQVKTRLAVATGPDWAARVARAFLCDLVRRVKAIHAVRFLCYAPAGGASFFKGLAGDQFDLTLQGEGDLGERLARFFADRFVGGAERVVVLGCDSPTVPLDFIEQAFQMLERAEVVLGPATDGGYYLVGCAGGVPPIFTGIDWGGRHVLRQTLERLSEPGWRLAVLPPWYDVDTWEDLQFLRTHLDALRRAGTEPDLPHTTALLDRFPWSA